MMKKYKPSRRTSKEQREEMLSLRSKGKTYNQIAKTLDVSECCVYYHCNPDKYKKKKEKPKKVITPLQSKLYYFTSRAKDENADRIMEYEVIKRHGTDLKCYLTGRAINLDKPTEYHLDHIVPKSKGGSGGIENLGFTTREANVAKSNLSVEEFLELCKDVLTNNGYEVTCST
jgi:5-methylcytosine-specific restriction endonuclease McrA